MENLSTCPVCGGKQLNASLKCKDFVASGEYFQLTRCADCSFLFTNPRPDMAHIGRYYESNSYVSHDANQRGITYTLYKIVKRFAQGNKLKKLNQYSKSRGLLLDYGCGTGDFLVTCQNAGWSVNGMDASAIAIEKAKQTTGISTIQHNQAIYTTPNNTYDAISMWHVLEHLHQLNEEVAQLKRVLKPGGTWLIAVPNSASWDAAHYKEYWDAYDVPRHLYHFNPLSMKKLLEAHGLKLVDVLPMWFDAPYISIRSEVFRKNPLAFLAGGLKGIYSNLKAAFTGQYSSLLFIVEK